jgi:hypothetical protein
MVMTNWRGTFEKLGTRLDITWPVDPNAVTQVVDSFLSRSLRHFEEEDHSFINDHNFPHYIRKSYEALLQAATDDSFDPSTVIDQCYERYIDELSSCPVQSLLADEIRLREEKDCMIAELRDLIKTKESQLLDLVNRLQMKTDEYMALYQRASNTENDIFRLQSLLEDARKQSILKEQSLKEARSYAVRRDAELCDLKRKLSQIISSRSWRVTAPLRTIRNGLSQLLNMTLKTD